MCYLLKTIFIFTRTKNVKFLQLIVIIYKNCPHIHRIQYSALTRKYLRFMRPSFFSISPLFFVFVIWPFRSLLLNLFRYYFSFIMLSIFFRRILLYLLGLASDCAHTNILLIRNIHFPQYVAVVVAGLFYLFSMFFFSYTSIFCILCV